MTPYNSARTTADGAQPAGLPERGQTGRPVASPSPPPGQREAWPDFARACAIILVVLFHSRHATWLIGFQNDALADRIWPLVSDVNKPLRMPLFFFISGMLATSAVTKPWRDIAHKRVWNNLYLYFLWAAIYIAVIPAWPRLDWSSYTVVQQILMAIVGDSPAWYLWALTMFFLLARIAAPLPAMMMLAVTFVIATLAPTLKGTIHPPPRLMLQCLFFFFAGLRFREPAFALARRAGIVTLALATPVMLALIWAYHKNVFGTFPLAGIACVFWGIIASSLATRHVPLLRSFGHWMGSRTLQVYVLHFLVLTALLNLAATYLPGAVKGSPLAAIAAPLLLTLVTTLGCLALAYCLPRLKLGWLLKLPR